MQNYLKKFNFRKSNRKILMENDGLDNKVYRSAMFITRKNKKAIDVDDINVLVNQLKKDFKKAKRTIERGLVEVDIGNGQMKRFLIEEFDDNKLMEYFDGSTEKKSIDFLKSIQSLTLIVSYYNDE